MLLRVKKGHEVAVTRPVSDIRDPERWQKTKNEARCRSNIVIATTVVRAPIVFHNDAN